MTATSWRACSNSGSGARLDMVDKVVVVVVMKSRGGENHSFVGCVGMGRRNRSRRDLYNGCVEDINLSLYIRSEQLTSSHLTPPSVGFGFNLSLAHSLVVDSSAQLPSAPPRSFAVSVCRMVRREWSLLLPPGLDPSWSHRTHTRL